MATASPYSVIGVSVPRIEGRDKVTGRAIYSADVALQNVLWATNVRSPHPHARIVSVDVSQALRAPGVRAVLTGRDFPNVRTGRFLKDQPILCEDRVRFIGDRVAVVAAEDPEAAEEAALLVRVEYEALPAVFDPLEAIQPGAPVLHPDATTYAGWPADVPPGTPNLCAFQTWDRGDLAVGFAEAEVVIEHTFRTQIMHQGYLEPHVSIVAIGGDGRAEVWTSNKAPYELREDLAESIGRPQTDVVIHPITIGGDFGSKGSVADTPTAYAIARRTGRPVKFVLSSSEDLTATSPRHPAVVTIRSGLKRDGAIVARQVRVVWDTGAYGAFKPTPNGMLPGTRRAGGSYVIPHLHIEGICVYTNHVPCGYMRAPGGPQIGFSVEAHTDLLARELGMDPLEFRLRNVPHRTPMGFEGVAARVLRSAADAIGWAGGSQASSPANRAIDAKGRIPTQRIGRGISIVDRGTGPGEGSADVTVNPDGTVTVRTAAPDNGSGVLTTIAQVVAESFGLPVERVLLVRVSTDELPVDVGSGASRMTNVAGHAAIQACEQVKNQLAPLAQEALGAESVAWERNGWRGPDGRAITLDDLAARMIRLGEPAAHAQVTITTPPSEDTAYCVQAAEVEVDAETGQVQLRRLVAAQDVGTIINAIGHQAQIDGAIVQGIGYTLMEDLTIEGGHITASHLGDYKEPTIRDVPPLTTININTSGPGPFGAKAIGEIPIMPTPAAIANAVADAIGAPVFQLPITAERVLAALQEREPPPRA
jgi:carbon-monoxide dehydrogenase large subunit